MGSISQETTAHTSLAFSRAFICFLRNSDRILVVNQNLHFKTKSEILIDFDERKNPSWWDYELQGEGKMSEGFSGVLETIPLQHQLT